jgi:SAM-dependent methyltransferase
MLRKIRARLVTYRRIGWARSARIALDSLALEGLRLHFGFDRWHARSPTSARSYRRGLAALVSGLQPRVVVEVGCGLGAILSRVEAPERVGYDVDARAVRAARFLHGRSIKFRIGGFAQVIEPEIDVLIAVNWPHDFAPEELKRWIAPLLPRVRYLLLDMIERSSPLRYRFYHDFVFLAGKAGCIHSDSFGEQHRQFLLYRVVR